jgi:uncharacterized protein
MILLLIALFPLLPRLLRALHGAEPRRGGGRVAQMVRCARCAVFVPVAEALPEGGKYYCSDEHRRLGPAPQQ